MLNAPAASKCRVADSERLSAIRPGFRLYFNLSARQVSDLNLVESFIRARDSGVDLCTLGIEVTETDAMRDVEATRRVCAELRALGVSVAIDDFGSGYSSLSFLKQLQVDVLKIDRSFIAGVADDRHDQTITETILAIAENFGFIPLAEGVETPEQLAWLRERSCRLVQGFGICRPLPLDAFIDWLRSYPA